MLDRRRQSSIISGITEIPSDDNRSGPGWPSRQSSSLGAGVPLPASPCEESDRLDTSDSVPLAPHLGISGILKAAILSNNTYSMVGNLLIVSHLNLGLGLNLFCAGLAVYNEAMARLRLRMGTSSGEEDGRGGVYKIKAVVTRPGIYRYSLSLAFISCAAEHYIYSASNPILTPTFIFLALGNFFTAQDIDRDLSSRAPGPIIERANPLRECLSNGALWWGIADILAGISALGANGLSILEAPPIFFAAATTSVCGIAAVFALGGRANSSALPFSFNAACNCLFALGNFQHLPSGGIAPTLALWGTGSLILAVGKLGRSPVKPNRS